MEVELLFWDGCPSHPQALAQLRDVLGDDAPITVREIESEEQAIAERFERANDDYSSIMVKALADRFAEAFAEAMHEHVRRDFWGYAPDEAFTPEELIAEPYRGIRPAPGYPAQPDHSEKATLFRLLDAEAACQLAVYLHGAAGELADADTGEVSMIAGDMADHIGDAILELTARRRVVDKEDE